MYIDSQNYYENNYCNIIKNNNEIIFNKKEGYGTFCWFGYSKIEEGPYNIKFNIKINKSICCSNNCGFKLHNPVLIYNHFFNCLKINEENECCIQSVYIKQNDLCIFIFDSLYEEINIIFKNIIFETIPFFENIIPKCLKSKTFSFCISINIHENIEFLKKQLNNIKLYVKDTYLVILNCNKYMYCLLQNINLDNNIIINPKTIEKQRHHGSLFQGIYDNMDYVLQHYDFSFFIILSSRNIFYNEINLEKMQNLNSIIINHNINKTYNDWFWPIFLKLKLFDFCIKNNYSLCNGAHEGLVFYYSTCKDMVVFLNNNVYMRDELFNFYGCIEECAFQTMSNINLIIKNGKLGFKYIGHGIDTQYTIPTDKNLYVFKTLRHN
jgi:hypothetical protein